MEPRWAEDGAKMESHWRFGGLRGALERLWEAWRRLGEPLGMLWGALRKRLIGNKKEEGRQKKEGKQQKEERRKEKEDKRKEKKQKKIYTQTPDQPLLAAPYYIKYNI